MQTPRLTAVTTTCYLEDKFAVVASIPSRMHDANVLKPFTL